MKIALVLLTFISALSIKAQDKVLFEDGNCEYEKVYTLDSVSADDLYSRVKKAIAILFVSSQDVTQLDDKDKKQLIIKAGKGAYSPNPFNKDGGFIRYMVDIQCRDGRFKVVISQATHEAFKTFKSSGGPLCNEKPGGMSGYITKKHWEKIKSTFYADAILLAKDIYDEVKKTGAASKEDW